MRGLKIGHFTQPEQGTGVTVFLCENGAVGAYQICGAAPATHELVVLDPENTVSIFHALVFTGGSAYGLFAAAGVMRYLTEKNIGYPTPHGIVPIVPAAAIYDLSYQSAIPPSAEGAYVACLSAVENNTVSGRLGAGTGATIGKLVPHARMMSGGLGFAEITLANGLQICAYAVVNCVGDVLNAQNEIVAGAALANHQFANSAQHLLSGKAEYDLFSHSNSTLIAVFTNAKFDKAALNRLSKMAIAGMARSISPIFTRFDGDMVFCVSVGDEQASELTVGTLAAEVTRLAILDAVRESIIL